MKKLLLLLFIAVSAIGNAATVTVSGDITSSTTWTNNNIYLLSGFVYVTNNATLTIQPGTVIMGEQATKGSLIITRGAKIIADGTKNQPIVFTSDQPAGSRTYGDWGGLLILGKATINVAGGETLAEGSLDPLKGLYGGGATPDDDDSSGIVRYVRIEFAGIAFQANSEINGLTLGGVGRKTLIDYVQVSYSGDDSYECFGGTVNAKHLIAYRGWDDDFDTDFGYGGKLQFLVSLRDSNIADPGSGSNGFESDNDGTGTTNTPITSPVFSNVSIFGPQVTSATAINTNFKRALHLRRNTKTSTYNSVFTGFPTGLKIEGSTTATNVTNNELQFKNNIIAGCSTPLDSSSMSFNMANWFTSNTNSILSNSSDVMANDPFNYSNPDFLPQAGSPLLNSADFTSAKLTDPFFSAVSYSGAFGSEDWTSCWAEWDPNASAYSAAINNPASVAAFSVSGGASSYTVTLSNSSSSADSYLWDFGVTASTTDTSTQFNPSFTYAAAGTYTITLYTFSPCGDDSTKQTVGITVGVEENESISHVNVYPNPANGNTIVDINLLTASPVHVSLLDISGRSVANVTDNTVTAGTRSLSIDVSQVPVGMYLLRVQTDASVYNSKISVVR